jgi:hypothetical protein
MYPKQQKIINGLCYLMHLSAFGLIITLLYRRCKLRWNRLCLESVYTIGVLLLVPSYLILCFYLAFYLLLVLLLVRSYLIEGEIERVFLLRNTEGEEARTPSLSCLLSLRSCLFALKGQNCLLILPSISC